MTCCWMIVMNDEERWMTGDALRERMNGSLDRDMPCYWMIMVVMDDLLDYDEL